MAPTLLFARLAGSMSGKGSSKFREAAVLRDATLPAVLVLLEALLLLLLLLPRLLAAPVISCKACRRRRRPIGVGVVGTAVLKNVTDDDGEVDGVGMNSLFPFVLPNERGVKKRRKVLGVTEARFLSFPLPLAPTLPRPVLLLLNSVWLVVGRDCGGDVRCCWRPELDVPLNIVVEFAPFPLIANRSEGKSSVAEVPSESIIATKEGRGRMYNQSGWKING